MHLCCLISYRFLAEYATCRPFCCWRIHIGCASVLQWMVSCNFIFPVLFVCLTLLEKLQLLDIHTYVVNLFMHDTADTIYSLVCSSVLSVNRTWWFLTFYCRVFYFLPLLTKPGCIWTCCFCLSSVVSPRVLAYKTYSQSMQWRASGLTQYFCC